MGSWGNIGRRSFLNCAPLFRATPAASLETPSLGFEAYHNPLKRKRDELETSDSSPSHSGRDDDPETQGDAAENQTQPREVTKPAPLSARPAPHGPARQAWPEPSYLDLLAQQCCAARDAGLADLLERLGQSTEPEELSESSPVQAGGIYMPPCFSNPVSLDRIASWLEGVLPHLQDTAHLYQKKRHRRHIKNAVQVPLFENMGKTNRCSGWLAIRM
jgi:hypothetical protein